MASKKSALVALLEEVPPDQLGVPGDVPLRPAPVEEEVESGPLARLSRLRMFEIGEGERVSLSAAGVVFDRDTGLLAATKIPDIQLALEHFDPHLHQEGYAPDRASTLVIRTPNNEQQVHLDRAKGVSVEGLSIYQAIPFGIALNVNISGTRHSQLTS